MGVAPAIDLTAGQRRTVLALLNRHLPNTTVWAYGSRVKWTSHPASDLDLVAFAEPKQGARVAELREAFDESNLPFRVDLFIWDDVPESFQTRIKADHVVLASKNTSFEIHGWRKLPFSNAVLLNPPVSLDRGKTYPFVDMAAIRSGSRCVEAAQRRKYSGGGSRFRTGDTLMARITPCLENGKIARYCGSDASESAHGSTEFIVVRGRPEVTDTEFAHYLTRWDEVRSYAVSQMSGTSGRQRVATESLNHLAVPVPPIHEQRAIAQVLGAFDDKIELNRRMGETLEGAISALFKSWFVDFDPVRAQMRGSSVELLLEITCLFPSRLVDSDVGDIPDGWGVSSLGKLVEFAYGKALRSDERQGGDIPVYGSNGQIGWHDRKIVNGPGIVVGRKGNPGVVTWSQSDFFPIDTTFYVVPKGPKRKVGLRFLFYALRNQNLHSIAADSAVPGLNRNIAYMSPQLVPSAEVTEAFDSHADSILSRRDQLGVESRLLANLRDTLLPKLLSGEIRIRDAEKIAETAT